MPKVNNIVIKGVNHEYAKKKILVVDDNTEYGESVIDVLELDGYNAEAVYDGSECLEAVKGHGRR